MRTPISCRRCVTKYERDGGEDRHDRGQILQANRSLV
jgi:hypothetical protein